MDQIPVLIEIDESADGIAQGRRRREQFDRNSAWLQEHISEVYAQHRGKFICIAGAELFVSDNANDAIAQATAAHPDDNGWFTRYIPRKKLSRVYAN